MVAAQFEIPLKGFDRFLLILHVIGIEAPQREIDVDITGIGGQCSRMARSASAYCPRFS